MKKTADQYAAIIAPMMTPAIRPYLGAIAAYLTTRTANPPAEMVAIVRRAVESTWTDADDELAYAIDFYEYKIETERANHDAEAVAYFGVRLMIARDEQHRRAAALDRINAERAAA